MEGGLGEEQCPYWNAHLCLFSLIQCAISRCIIYFCVKSLTAVICHDEDDDDSDDDDSDRASFSRDKDAMPYMAHTTVSCVQIEERSSDLYRK